MDHQERFILLFPAARARAINVFMLGAGAIGSWLGVMLAKMGIEHFIIVDDDTVGADRPPLGGGPKLVARLPDTAVQPLLS